MNGTGDFNGHLTFKLEWWEAANGSNLTAEQCVEKYGIFTNDIEQGNIDISTSKGYYIKNKGTEYGENENFNYKSITIYFEANSEIYQIYYYGDEQSYNKYYKTFEKMLETVEFTTPTFKDMIQKETEDKNQEKTKDESVKNRNNNTEETTSNSVQKEKFLCGDANCDEEVNGKDLIAIKKYINGERELTEQGKINADVNDDEAVNNADVKILKKYLAGIYSKLPQRTSGEEFTAKAVPGMSIKYPEDWTVEEIDKGTWGQRTGNATCIFRGSINNIRITVTTYDPLFKVGGYKNLIKQECSRYGINYYEGLEENGYNVGDNNKNNLDWRILRISSNIRNYYHIIDKNVDNSLKIEVKIENPTGENQLPVERIIDDIILGTTVRSY